MSSTGPSYEAKDERNVVSWRVPNVPKQAEVTEEVPESAAKKDPKDTPKSVSSAVSERTASAFSDSGPNSPADGRKGQKSPKLFTDFTSEEPKNNYGGKLWRMLFGNVVRSIDELYVHCEEQEDRSKCQEIVELLARSRSDFKKLSSRLEEQSKFQKGQAMSWEIRKPTLPSPMNPIASHLEQIEDERERPALISPTTSPVVSKRSSSPAPAAATDVESVAVPKINEPRRLNPAAKPFNPSGSVSITAPSVQALPPPTQPTAAAAANTAGDRQPVPFAPAAAPAMVETTTSPRGGSPRSPRGTLSSHSDSPPTLVLPAPAVRAPPPPPGLSRARSQSQSSGGGSAAKRKQDDWSDKRLQMAVQQASEQVWAAAEAWVEAECEAEEQEWALLALGINSYLHEAGALSDDDETLEFPAPRSPLLSSQPAHNSPKQFPGMSVGLLQNEALSWEGNFVALSPEQRAIWEQTPPSRYGAGKSLGWASGAGGGGGGAGGLSRSRTSSRTNLLAAAAAGASAVAAGVSSSATGSGVGAAAGIGTGVAASAAATTTPVANKRKVPTATPTAASATTPTADISVRTSRSSGDSSPVRSRYSDARSPSQSPTDAMFTTAPGSAVVASGGRSLHDKLSSPDRKRSISPSEALRRYEERQINAEINRDQTLAERVQKAHIASERVRAREQREAARKAAVLSAIEAKQRNVEERRAQFLRSIQSRANNETTKVQEVSFINALNSEAIAQRLEEVETRILAASARRQDSLDQRRRSTRKVEQLSEWRLQFEKEKMERWGKLQQRLDQVNARRAARLKELQRRADEESQRLLLDAVSGAAGGAGVAEVASAIIGAAPASAAAGATEVGAGAAAAAVEASAVKGAAVETPGINKRSGRSTTPSSIRLSAALRSPAPVAVVSDRAAPPSTAPATSTAGACVQTNTQSQTGAGCSVSAADASAVDASEEKSRSKAREKKEKRKLKAQLLELARAADIAALQEAIAQNNVIGEPARSGEKAVAAPAASVGSSAGVRAFPTMDTITTTAAAEIYVAARCVLHSCPSGVVTEGFAAWRQLTDKKVSATARADAARHCAENLRTEYSADANLTSAATAPALDPSYTTPLAEDVLLQRLQSDGAGNLLAQVVRELMSSARRVRAGEVEGTALTPQVMQRLYVLLQHEPTTPGSPVGPTAQEGVSEVLLLRMVLGPEVGLLREAAEVQSFCDALLMLLHLRPSATATTPQPPLSDLGVVSSMDLEVRAEVWKLLFDMLGRCTASPATTALCVQCGLGAVLVDLLQVLLMILDAHHKKHAESSYPSAVELAVSAVTVAMTQGLACPISAAGGLDALVWYLFTLGQVPLVADHLRVRLQQLQHQRSYHYRSERAKGGDTQDNHGSWLTVDVVSAAAGYLGAVGRFVRFSGNPAGTVVESVLQLSPAHHRHSKGRQLVSILRRADIVTVLLALAAEVCGSDVIGTVGCGTQKTSAKAAYLDHLALLCSLITAVADVCGADLSLAQYATTPEAQAKVVHSLSTALQQLQSALDGLHQPLLNAPASGSFGHLLGHLQTEVDKSFVEDALRSLFVAVNLVSLRQPSMQKVCGSILPSSTSATTATSSSLLHTDSSGKGEPLPGRAQTGPPPSATSWSLLQRLCSLSPKYYKENKFRHHVLPCLIALCLDCDSNLIHVYRAQKLPFLVRYLEQSVRTLEIYHQQQAKGKKTEGSATAAVSSGTTEEALYVQRLSALLPTEVWSVAQLTFAPPSAEEK